MGGGGWLPRHRADGHRHRAGQRHRVLVHVAARDTGDNISPATGPVTATPSSDETPPGAVTALTVDARTSDSITLSWTNPTDPDLTTVVVRRVAGTTPPTGPDKGDPVRLPYPDELNRRRLGAARATHYSYAVFTQDATGNTGAGLTVATTTRDTTVDLCARGLTTDTT